MTVRPAVLGALATLATACFSLPPPDDDGPPQDASTGASPATSGASLTATSTSEADTSTSSASAGPTGTVSTAVLTSTVGESGSGGESGTTGAGEDVVFAFTDEPCAGVDWRYLLTKTDFGPLDCDDDPDAAVGYAGPIDVPEGPALRIVPSASDDGVVSGTWDAIAVQAGDRLRVEIRCPHGAAQCDIDWQVALRHDGQNPPLDFWDGRQVAAGEPTELDVDLTPFADTPVDFTFAVLAGAAHAGDDAAHVVRPRIVRE